MLDELKYWHKTNLVLTSFLNFRSILIFQFNTTTMRNQIQVLQK